MACSFTFNCYGLFYLNDVHGVVARRRTIAPAALDHPFLERPLEVHGVEAATDRAVIQLRRPVHVPRGAVVLTVQVLEGAADAALLVGVLSKDEVLRPLMAQVTVSEEKRIPVHPGTTHKHSECDGLGLSISLDKVFTEVTP